MLVLLIGCVNIAGLLLARGVRRSREFATRMALGGGRGAILRQLLSESLLLALLGGLVGVAVGWAGLGAASAFAQSALGVMEPRLDARALAATLLLSVLTSLVFGLFPALRTTRLSLRPALVSGGARGATSGVGFWARRVLVTAQVALGVVLLVGAGLLVRTLLHLRGLEPGFDPNDVMTATVSLDDARYHTSADVNRLFDEVISRIEALPGVEHAAAGLSLPFERALNVPFRLSDGEIRLTSLTYVTPGYFEALKIPVLRGRGVTEADREDSPPIIVVNRAFVDEYFADQDLLGQSIEIENVPRLVVGIVGDVRQTPSWGSYGPLGQIPAAYLPARQTADGFVEIVHTWFAPSWIVRTSGPQQGVVSGIQRAIGDVDPYLPIVGFRSVEEVLAETLGAERQQAALFSTLAGLALLLGATGIAGLIGNSVTERTRELGIRLTLGSTRARAVWTAAKPGVLLAAAGVFIGLLLAAWLAQMLQAFVYGISTSDPLTFAGVAALLLLTAAAASLIPALRIARLDPAQTLRQE
jgi:predicted permease